jgi:hypothetical protein
MIKSWKADLEKRVRNQTKELYFISVMMLLGFLAGFTDFATRPIPISGVISIVALAGIVFLIKKKFIDRKQVPEEVAIDYGTGAVVFRNHTFISKFTGNKKSDKVIVPFSGIFRSKSWRHKGNFFIEVKTNHGIVTISRLEEIESLAPAFEEIVRENESQNPHFESEFASAPKPKTAWYGWLIIFAAVAIVIAIGWFTMYQ